MGLIPYRTEMRGPTKSVTKFLLFWPEYFRAKGAKTPSLHHHTWAGFGAYSGAAELGECASNKPGFQGLAPAGHFGAR
jgi:hypothetical protein